MMQQKNYASQIHRCFRCGYCKFPTDYSSFNCPSTEGSGLRAIPPVGDFGLFMPG